MNEYPVRLTTRYDGLVIATFPDFPQVTALGRDDEEALEEARHQLDVALRERRQEGSNPPGPEAAREDDRALPPPPGLLPA